MSPEDNAIIGAAKQAWQDQQFLKTVLNHAGPAAVRKTLEAAGYQVDPDGKLISKRGDCESCGRYRRLQLALNSDRFLCPDCWTEDLCTT